MKILKKICGIEIFVKMINEIISAKEYWLVSEFLKTQPLQFLYYIVSKINGSEILMSKQI